MGRVLGPPATLRPRGAGPALAGPAPGQPGSAMNPAPGPTGVEEKRRGWPIRTLRPASLAVFPAPGAARRREVTPTGVVSLRRRVLSLLSGSAAAFEAAWRWNPVRGGSAAAPARAQGRQAAPEGDRRGRAILAASGASRRRFGLATPAACGSGGVVPPIIARGAPSCGCGRGSAVSLGPEECLLPCLRFATCKR